MDVRIEHCTVCWGYRDRALVLAEALRKRFGANVEVVGGTLGQFDVCVDGELVSSRGGNLLARIKPPRLPEVSDVIALVQRSKSFPRNENDGYSFAESFENRRIGTEDSGLNEYERAIVRNADWFVSKQTREGFIDADGDEFYGIRGDATLVGHSATVRCYASVLTGSNDYLESARRSLDWLAARQDSKGGWRGHSAFTLDGAQCVFEGFNTFERITGDRSYRNILVRAANRMVEGTLKPDGSLRLADIIEIGEYAHFAILAWKTTGEPRFKSASEQLLAHIERNFDKTEGMWLPFDVAALRRDALTRVIRPVLRLTMLTLPLRGRIIARFSDHLAPLAVTDTYPQYSMSLMDAECLLDTLDGGCDFPRLKEQTKAAIAWTEAHCKGPFPGSVVESKRIDGRAGVYPIPILNDTRKAALWPTTGLLIAYCGMNDETYREKARSVADWILTMQDEKGGFSNFRNPDGSTLPLQSGNVNFSASMALWLFNEVYNRGRSKLFTEPRPV